MRDVIHFPDAVEFHKMWILGGKFVPGFVPDGAPNHVKCLIFHVFKRDMMYSVMT